MKRLLFLLPFLPYILSSQEQITFYELEQVDEFSYNYYYITDVGDEYLMHRAAEDYYVQKIENEDLSPHAEFASLGETYRAHCEDVRDCMFGDYFVEIIGSELRVNNLRTDETLHDNSLDGFGRVEKFTFDGEKMYLSSEADNDDERDVAIYHYIQNTFEIIEHPDLSFIGRSGKHIYFADQDGFNIYYYNEDTESFDFMHSTVEKINHYFVTKTDKEDAVVIQTEDSKLLVLRSPDSISEYNCSPINYSTLRDHMLIGNKFVFYDIDMYSFYGTITIYNLLNCAEIAKKSISAAQGEFTTGDALEGKYIFYESDFVDIGTAGSRGVIDLEKNIFIPIFGSIRHFYPKYALKNDTKVFIPTENVIFDNGYTWNEILEFDVWSNQFEYHDIIKDPDQYEELSYGTFPYGTDQNAFNVYTSNREYGYQQYHFEYDNEVFNRTLIDEFSIQTGELVEIEQYNSMDNKLVFNRNNKHYVYDEEDLIFSKDFSSSTDFIKHENSLTFASVNGSERKIYQIIEGSNQVKSTNLTAGYDLHYLIAENGYFKNTSEHESVQYLDLTDYSTQNAQNSTKIKGEIEAVNGEVGLIRGYTNSEEGYYLHNTQSRKSRFIGKFSEHGLVPSYPIEKNGFIFKTRSGSGGNSLRKYTRVRENGDKVTLREIEFSFGLKQQVIVNEDNGFLLALQDDQNTILISENEDEVLEFDIESFWLPDFYKLKDKVVIDAVNNEDEIYLYDFENEPILLEGVSGRLISVQAIGARTFFFFVDNLETRAYELINENQLEYLASQERSNSSIEDYDRFAMQYDEENILLPTTTDEYGRELFLFNINTNSFDILSDIYPSGSSDPDNFTYDGDILYFTALPSKNNRQWFKLKLELPLNEVNPDKQDAFELTPTLSENQVFFSSDLEEYVIFNSNGQVVFSGSNYAAQTPINMHGWAAGIYFMESRNADQYYISKFFKFK